MPDKSLYVKLQDIENILDDAQQISNGEYSGYCTEDVPISSIEKNAMQIIHCRECIYYKLWRMSCNNFALDENPRYCSYGGRPNLHFPVGPDDFCSLGVRRESGGKDDG